MEIEMFPFVPGGSQTVLLILKPRAYLLGNQTTLASFKYSLSNHYLVILAHTLLFFFGWDGVDIFLLSILKQAQIVDYIY